MVRDADVTLVVSESERSALLVEVPDCGYSHRLECGADRVIVSGFGERRDMLFVGGFGHRPNVDAINWYARGGLAARSPPAA
jgi:hypothetical protein